MSFLKQWLLLTLAIPAGLLFVLAALFTSIGWLAAVLAFSSGRWAWGVGLSALWCVCAAFFAVDVEA